MNGHGHGHHPPTETEAPGPQDKPDFHGMLVFGRDPAYLSHLPMPHTPHNYQVLLDGRFVGSDGDGKDGHSVYMASQAQSSETVYTFKPRNFRITGLVAADPGQRISALDGALLRGHFDGEELHPGHAPETLLDRVRFEITRVLHFHRIESAKPTGRLGYHLIGQPGALYLVHRITGIPSFDQVIEVAGIDPLPPPDVMTGDQPVLVTVDRKDLLSQRLQPDTTVQGELVVPGAADPVPITLTLGTELYFEEGELRVDATLDPTPDELRAGF